MSSILRALALVAAALAAGHAAAATTITVATFPDLDRAAKAALPRWHAAHPDIDVKIVSLQYADHHTAMTTALATGSGLPDVMAIDFKFIGKFAGSGGFEDLNKPPYDAGALRTPVRAPTRSRRPPTPRASSRALPADIGPGTLLYRADLVAKAGLTEADLTQELGLVHRRRRQAQGRDRRLPAGRAAPTSSTSCCAPNLPAGEGIYFDRAGKVLVDDAALRARVRARPRRAQGRHRRRHHDVDQRVGGGLPLRPDRRRR